MIALRKRWNSPLQQGRYVRSKWKKWAWEWPLKSQSIAIACMKAPLLQWGRLESPWSDRWRLPGSRMWRATRRWKSILNIHKQGEKQNKMITPTGYREKDHGHPRDLFHGAKHFEVCPVDNTAKIYGINGRVDDFQVAKVAVALELNDTCLNPFCEAGLKAFVSMHLVWLILTSFTWLAFNNAGHPPFSLANQLKSHPISRNIGGVISIFDDTHFDTGIW